MAKDLGILYFGKDNAKLEGQPVRTFSLPAGYTCPGAKGCKAHFDRVLRKIVDGVEQIYRCFAATTEAMRPSVAASVDRNWSLLKEAKTVSRMAALIDLSLPAKHYIRIRIHVDGDYYSRDYMMAWIEVARRNPDRTFYGYTTSLHHWVALRDMIPANMIMHASKGGKFDHLIEPNNLPWSLVVFHPEEAEAMGLEIDHDDSHAWDPDCHAFCLLIHSTGPPGSKHSEAMKRLRREDIKFSYSRKK